MSVLPQSPVEALKILASVEFKPFDEGDWMAFAGCESDEPMIGYYGEIAVILDGAGVTFNLYNDGNGEPEWTNFTLKFDGAF